MVLNQLCQLFVFGAGASYASGGTPLGEDLVWDWYANCSTFPVIGSNGKPTTEAIQEENAEFEDFGKFLEFARERYPALSDVYSQWQRAMREGEHLMLDIAKPYYIDEIMEDLVRDEKFADDVQLVRKIAAKHITQTSEIHTNGFYNKFVKNLKNKGRDEVAIITFNFDCLLRDDLKDQVYFDYLLEFERIDSLRCFYKDRRIPFLKLHGSLDWELDPHVNGVTLLPAEWHESYGGEPCIFLPHEQTSRKISELWDAAAELVQRAKMIIFVGYSLPDYDKDALRLFQANVQRGTQIVVIDSSSTTIEKYKRLFSHVAVKGILCDLKDKNRSDYQQLIES